MLFASVTLRPADKDGDAPLFVELVKSCQEVDSIDPYSTREDIPNVEDTACDFAQIDPATMQVAIADGKMVAYVRLMWWREKGDKWVYLHVGRVAPQWREHGLGTRLLHWAEEEIRRLATTVHPTQGKWEYAANASSTETAATELLLHEGYHILHTMIEYKLADFTWLDETRFTPEFQVRTLTPDQYRPLWDAQHNVFWASEATINPLPDEAGYQEYIKRISQPHFDPSLWFILWDKQQIVATVQTRVTHKHGYIDEVSTHPGFRRRGVGRDLMLHALRELQVRGVEDVRLFTRENNASARALYEKLRFCVHKKFSLYRKEEGKG